MLRKGAQHTLAFTVLFALFFVIPASTQAGAAPRCSTKKGSCSSTTDTTPPTVTIATPANGATISGAVTIAGSASDNSSLAKVEVAVDAGAFVLASGTSSWSYTLDSTTYANGAHTITARATDGSGNTSTASIGVTVSNQTGTNTGGIVDPTYGTDLVVLGRGRMAEYGTVSALLYTPRLAFSPSVYFRDASTGASTEVSLPQGTANGPSWANATTARRGLGEMWVFSGGGPVYARQYRLSGSPLPTTATLLSITTFGDTDSRAGEMTLLGSGGITAAWFQQGSTGAQGQGIAYLSPSGAWSTIYPLQFMPTKASSQAIAQDPSGGIWVFCDPDAWGAIGATHLTETTSALRVDWTNGLYISTNTYGALGPDPENPDLEAVSDPSTGSVALAYESDTRQIFSTSPFVAGSYPAVARITSAGAISFTVLPVYVERVSQLGLAVRSGETWLEYRPVNPTTLTSADLYLDTFRNGAWIPSTHLGTLGDLGIGFGMAAPNFAARFTDGILRALSY